MNPSSALPDVESLLDHMADALRVPLAEHGGSACLIGIHTGGIWVAEGLHRRLGLDQAMGTLDITYYRDDLSRGGLHPHIRPSRLPWSVDDQLVILVDDVLHTGRTVRAALNEIFDFGRPARVLFATLVDRGGHELPISADVIGARYDDLLPTQRIKLSGPDPLMLTLVEREASAQ
ncbi:bifunctional pyr operon transcriptional regulator/uracil phosphoribosyltransferase [Acidihalobacter yilgarnensis]|uniref:Bifunctional pyr operon transcriptional regulator/uracil phosphoribosyltransferase n=1 Tax=Acidihalobacter yilgarnensis TaxID=2819280 RepID=A0A1D8IK55_9GAMM|nr:bifunctional pyr operon transcriptional regulator/uracil phosphoribosyltransferase PyrR [Acidihalobacter yilgarnensis]AOU96835.1 bifunctional pyr operon transcriptional regulator/uracil phosphoribosyltransferase [Acidihalobacter yilgarnensis]